MGKKKNDKKEPKVLDIPGFGDVMKDLDKLTVVKPGKPFKRDGVTYHANGGSVSLSNFEGSF